MSRPTLGQTVHVGGSGSCKPGADHTFFPAISFMTSISRSRSASNFFSRAFSCSSWRSRLTSSGVHRPEVLAPRVDRLLAHPVLLRHFGDRRLIRFAQDRHRLGFRESALSHDFLFLLEAILSSFTWSENPLAGQPSVAVGSRSECRLRVRRRATAR
ncbi:hypothetical protein, INTERPRO suggestion: probable Aminoacyl-tRNA synthetase, class I (plasmid) [Aromatoleum aromaticum EbN1]|uniref:Uncharacterized protein n=1 Tax=Aromatoleum aromaticum (strain DSM 19018 / LMG 30748 / EbN1) TaxID=76114 RepID=Q5NW74_AROAE|nr:hypothetical protein, INTERPRO suggestion: probable Aminoacyl-tRNA synthetase, class I [Aromatoleum aromaticum EbN1]